MFLAPVTPHNVELSTVRPAALNYSFAFEFDTLW